MDKKDNIAKLPGKTHAQEVLLEFSKRPVKQCVCIGVLDGGKMMLATSEIDRAEVVYLLNLMLTGVLNNDLEG